MSIELAHLSIGSRVSRLTVEQVLYTLIVIVAIVFRLISLDNIPLSPAESEQALTIWRLWSPNNNDPAIISPAYFSLTAVLTLLFGFSDEIVRMIPALFGIGVVILPWFLRDYLTRSGMMVTAILLALSPTQNLISRTAGGGSIAVFSVFLVFVSWLRLKNRGRHRWLTRLAIGLALLFASSPGVYTAIVSFALAWLVQRKLGSQHGDDEPADSEITPFLQGPQIRRILEISLPIFFILSTCILLRPDGIGTSADMPLKWLAQFKVDGSLAGLFDPLLIIMRYELAVLILAIPALLWSIWDTSPLPSLLTYWFLITLVISFFQPDLQVNVVFLTVPAYLLAGHLVGQSLKEETGQYKWYLAGILVISSLIAYVNLIRFLRLSLYTELPIFSYNIVLVASAGLGAAILLSLVWNWHSALAKQGFLVATLLLVAFYYWGTAWWMTRQGANDTRERWVVAASDEEITELAEVVSATSMEITGSDVDLEIVTTVHNPALEWYLRDMVNLEHFSELPVEMRSQAIITPNTEAPVLEDSYIGADFGYIRTRTAGALAPRQSLSWWFFHLGFSRIEDQRLIFWVRGDLSGAPT